MIKKILILSMLMSSTVFTNTCWAMWCCPGEEKNPLITSTNQGTRKRDISFVNGAPQESTVSSSYISTDIATSAQSCIGIQAAGNSTVPEGEQFFAGVLPSPTKIKEYNLQNPKKKTTEEKEKRIDLYSPDESKRTLSPMKSRSNCPSPQKPHKPKALQSFYKVKTQTLYFPQRKDTRQVLLPEILPVTRDEQGFPAIMVNAVCDITFFPDDITSQTNPHYSALHSQCHPTDVDPMVFEDPEEINATLEDYVYPFMIKRAEEHDHTGSAIEETSPHAQINALKEFLTTLNVRDDAIKAMFEVSEQERQAIVGLTYSTLRLTTLITVPRIAPPVQPIMAAETIEKK